MGWKSQDDAYNDRVRDNRFQKELEKINPLICRGGLDTARQIPSRTELIPKYTGSSYNAKPKPKKERINSKDVLFDEFAWQDLKITDAEKTLMGLIPTDPYFIETPTDKAPRIFKTTKRQQNIIVSKLLSFSAAVMQRPGFGKGDNKLTLQTLSFVNDLTDTKGMDCLNKYLTQLRDMQHDQTIEYFNKAERQKNGRIHFHIVFDRKLPIDYFNSLWASIQHKSGIIHAEKEKYLYDKYGMGVVELHDAKRYKEVQKKYNGLDVEYITSVDGISAYLTKYVVKNKDTFSCRHWTCSQSISRLFTGQIISQEQFESVCNSKKNRIKSESKTYKNSRTQKRETRPARTYVSKVFEGQYCKVISIFNKEKYKKMFKEYIDINVFLLECFKNRQKVEPEFIRRHLFITKYEFLTSNKRIDYLNYNYEN
jgi:hypothetical protein